MTEVDVLVESEGSNRQSTIFYGNDDAGMTAIAEAEDDEGNLYQLVSTGEITVRFEGELYTNEDIQELIEKQDLTDEKINDLVREGKMEWVNNNWFEVVWQNDEGDRWNSEIGVVKHKYDEAIDLLKKYADVEYANPENQTEVMM